MTDQLTLPSQGIRTYGGWRRARGIGLFGVGPAGTAIVLACVVLPVLLASTSLRLGALTLLPAAAVAGMTLARRDGMTLGEIVIRRIRWEWAAHRGWTTYQATTLDGHPRAWDLPGVLAPTALLTAHDASVRHRLEPP